MKGILNFNQMLLTAWLLAGTAWADVRIEYVAHACFVVESGSGQKLVIDPYNSHRWLGYNFPESLEADAVLISHPHYDHDANYYLGTHVPTFRNPGSYSIGEIHFQGFKGKHADPYGKDFNQRNTIWLIETGGIRIAHLGDNGPLGEELIEQLGRVDVLMIPIDSREHILKNVEVEQILQKIQPRITIPMHYQHPTLSRLPRSLGTIEPWLKGRKNVRRISGNSVQIRADETRKSNQILLLKTSPAVIPWSKKLRQAMAKVAGARDVLKENPQAAVKSLKDAADLAPESILIWWGLGRALAGTNQIEEAIRTLERGLSLAGNDDWEYTERARSLLAQLYSKTDKPDLAATQYRLVLASTYRDELRGEAEVFLRTLR